MVLPSVGEVQASRLDYKDVRVDLTRNKVWVKVGESLSDSYKVIDDGWGSLHVEKSCSSPYKGWYIVNGAWYLEETPKGLRICYEWGDDEDYYEFGEVFDFNEKLFEKVMGKRLPKVWEWETFLEEVYRFKGIVGERRFL